MSDEGHKNSRLLFLNVISLRDCWYSTPHLQPSHSKSSWVQRSYIHFAAENHQDIPIPPGRASMIGAEEMLGTSDTAPFHLERI